MTEIPEPEAVAWVADRARHLAAEHRGIVERAGNAIDQSQRLLGTVNELLMVQPGRAQLPDYNRYVAP